MLGGVFLCVTGAEALYADMGHFGARPIRQAWFVVVLPALVISYAGQAALVIDGAPLTGNIFYLLCPHVLLVPLVILATLATIIASQAIITGAFSMTRQAIILGWLPRLRIKQTSAEGYGQIYVGVVNWLLMVVTLGLTIGFGKSDNLAAAYGIAVSLTMLMTTVLLFIAMREILGWNVVVAGAITALFMVVDAAFVLANMAKILEGGYVPLLLAAGIYGIMLIWHRGASAMAARMKDSVVPIDRFVEQLKSRAIPRTPGTAVFLTRTATDTPPVMAWQVKHNRALHERCLIIHVNVLSRPWLRDGERLVMQEIAPDIWRGEASYGFMERPNIPALLKLCAGPGLRLRSRRRHLLRRPRDGDPSGGRRRHAVVAGGDLRPHGAQYRALRRLRATAERQRGRDRSADCHLRRPLLAPALAGQSRVPPLRLPRPIEQGLIDRPVLLIQAVYGGSTQCSKPISVFSPWERLLIVVLIVGFVYLRSLQGAAVTGTRPRTSQRAARPPTLRCAAAARRST